MQNSLKSRCLLQDLKVVTDIRGDLTIVEASKSVPFEIKRLFFITDVPSGQSRGGHAHRELEQAIICTRGQVTVRLEDGKEIFEIPLGDKSQIIYVPPMVWCEQYSFKDEALLLVLASNYYEESDYIRDKSDYLKTI